MEMAQVENPGASAAIAVRALCISAGHNYFGHHGKPAGQNKIIEVPRIECVTGRGVRGDRFFDYKDGYAGQITFFSWETFDQIRHELGIWDRSITVIRRNVITEGVDLNGLIGRDFWIQCVHFTGVEECRPCYWMDQAFGPGACEWLKGRGGLRARILNDGSLSVPGK